MKVGDIVYYGIKPDAFDKMDATELSKCEEGYTLVLSFELLNIYNGNLSYKMRIYQDATPKNPVINGWRINHEYPIYENRTGVRWEMNIKDVFGNIIKLNNQSQMRLSTNAISEFFTMLFDIITYGSPKVSTIAYHIKKMSRMYEHKECSKKYYMEMMDKVSNIENMKKLSYDEISSLPSSIMLEFNLLYMNMVDGVAHVIVKD